MVKKVNLSSGIAKLMELERQAAEDKKKDKEKTEQTENAARRNRIKKGFNSRRNGIK